MIHMVDCIFCNKKNYFKFEVIKRKQLKLLLLFGIDTFIFETGFLAAAIKPK